MSVQRESRTIGEVVTRVIAVQVAAIVGAGLLTGVSYAVPAEPEPGAPAVASSDRVVKGKNLGVSPRKTDPPRRSAPAVRWPKPGASTVALPTHSASAAGPGLIRAGDSPIWVGTAAKVASGASDAKVRVLDRNAVRKAGVDGVVFTVAVDKGEPSRLAVRLDYSGFGHAYGGDYAARLRLVRLPACAVTTPEKAACRTVHPLKSARNNGVERTLSAEVDTTGEALVFAATAGSSSDKGDFQATGLAPSAQWQVSEQSGDFGWTYPMRVPPTPGSLTPNVQVSYSSGSVDGRTSNTNNQPSWLGEGFELSPGFIERRYKACAEDGAPTDEWGNKPGDQCWAYENATVTWNGKGGELIKTSDGTWRLKSDDGTRFEKLASTARGNGDNDGEYWRVTTPDGVRYYFGYNRLTGWASGKPETKSTWTTPVFGNNSGEPCHGTSFASSWCDQAWRWNLDYVVDPHGNAITYYYNQEINYYGRNLKPADETRYVRGGWLDRVEYGLRSSDLFAKAPARVAFGTSERCIPGGGFDCDPSKISTNPDQWPDVPWDLNCASGTECRDGKGTVAPTFWSRKRLTKVTTQVQDSAGAYRDVDSWGFTHTWGDADADRALLLTSIRQTGHASSTEVVSLPAVTFNHVQLMNRVDRSGDDIPPFIKYRVGAVYDESGGQLEVNYSDTDCTLSDLPTPETNTRRCFPVYWTPPGREDPQRDWFHKYVVNQVIALDRTGGSPAMITNYMYLDGAAWHYDVDDGITKEKYKTWGQWRGYGRVQVTTGGFDDGMLTQRETLYLRGMHGDRAGPSGGSKTVTVADGEGVNHTDHEALNGVTLKTTVFDKPGGVVVEKSVNTPWVKETAKRIRSWGTTTANLTGVGKTHSWLAVPNGAWRETETINTHEPLVGRVIKVDDKGDTSSAADDLCTETTYAEDTTAWKLDIPSQVETVSMDCDATPDRSTQLVSDVRTYYDGGVLGAPPTKGDATKTEQIAAHNGTTPTYVTVAVVGYDAYGRTTSMTDALGQTSTVTYTETNGLTTKSAAATVPLVAGDPASAHVTTTVFDPAWGVPLSMTDPNNLPTRAQYDGLGRLRKVWLPNRSHTGLTPNVEYSYRVADDAIVAVGTKELNAQGGQKRESFKLYDGWLRPRQVQVPGPGGGRLIADTFYDARGNTGLAYESYYSLGSPAAALFGSSGADVETQTAYSYDGLNRVIAERLLVGNGTTQEKWRTTYGYSGDRTHVTPPAGGTATTTISDARGRTTELRQYHGGSPSGTYDATRYDYTPAGQLASVTDPAGDEWTYTYDLRGRKTVQVDPDSGTSRYGYDELDRLTSTQDARGEKLFHSYDPLGRRLETRAGSASGDLRTSWVYDTVRKGQLTSATRHANGQQYTTRVTNYDTLNRPIRTYVTIPTAEGALAGNYLFGANYRLDGLLQTNSFPTAGGMAAESVVHTYDADDLGRPTKLSGASTYVTNTRYSLTGKLEQLELGAGGAKTWITNTYEYGTQRLANSRVDRENVSGVDRSATYGYDPAGNITSIADVSRSGTDAQCFGYDYLRRLTEAWAQGAKDCAATPSDGVVGGPAAYWHSYGYEETGSNRTSETLHGVGGAADTVRSYTYPATEQPHTLTGVTQTGGAGGRTDSFGYDPAGNTITRTVAGKTQTLDWDPEGHLAKVTEDGKETSFLYDADGNRLIRRDPTGTTLYLPGMELRLDNGASAANATRYYTHAGQTVAIRTADGIQFLAGDHHGTALLSIDAADQTLTQRRYTPFGTERSLLGAWSGDKGYVGGTKDESTGLTHLGAREYDPGIGRFVSVDPLIDHTDPQQMHGYAYANNNPIAWSDPSGLAITECQEGCTGNGGLGDSVTNSKGDGYRSSEGRSHQRKYWAGAEVKIYGPSGNLSLNDMAAAKSGKGKTFHMLNPQAQAQTVVDTVCQNFGNSSQECQQAVLKRDGGEFGPADTAFWLGVFFVGMLILETGINPYEMSCRAGPNSFVPGTLVLMADGTYKSIEDIEVGDEVIATDPETGETTAKPVVALIAGEGIKHLVEITVDMDGNRGDNAGVVVATANHPFWVDDEGRWINAADLRAGDQLRAPNGDRLAVVATRGYTAIQRVHNLTVNGIHTYYAGVGFKAALVHNCPEGDSERSTGRTTPGGKNEQLAMDLVKENPQYGERLPVTMRDPRWPASEGWVKMSQTVDGVEIHYVYNTQTGAYDDFKFKDRSD